MVELDTNSALQSARRWWWVIVAFGVLGALVGALPSAKSTAQGAVDTTWQASYTALLSTPVESVDDANTRILMNQLELLATTGEVPKRVAEAIGFEGAPPELAAQITVQVDPLTGAIRITNSADSPDRAVTVADAFGSELSRYLVERQDDIRSQRIEVLDRRLDTLTAGIDDLKSQLEDTPDDPVLLASIEGLSREYSSIFGRYDEVVNTDGQLQMTTLEKAQAIAVTTKEGGLSAPTSRSSRAMLGGLVGLIVGFGVAVLLGRLDKRIRTREQAEAVFGLHCQVAIPDVKEPPTSIVVVPTSHDRLSDSYRKLRSVVSFVERGSARAAGRAPIIVVVSAGPGDGKTTVAANLAAAFVENGLDTIAVNSDFRRPQLSKYITGSRPDPIGFDIDELEHMPVAMLLSACDIDGLTILDLSSVSGSPIDLTRVSAHLIQANRAGVGGVVVVDTPPVSSTAEVLEMLSIADVVVVVARLDHTHTEAATHTMATVRTLSETEPILVLLENSSKQAHYYYKYGSQTPKEPLRRRMTRELTP